MPMKKNCVLSAVMSALVVVAAAMPVFADIILPVNTSGQWDWDTNGPSSKCAQPASGLLDGFGMIPAATNWFHNDVDQDMVYTGGSGPPSGVTAASILGIHAGDGCGFGGWCIWRELPGLPIWIAFDLGGYYNITGMDLWNWYGGGSGEATRGVKDADVYTLSSMPTNGAPQSEALGLTTSGATSLSFTDTVNSWHNTPNQPKSFTLSNARYVLFNVKSDWGDTWSMGISEVRFEGTPVVIPGTTYTFR